ncbi:cardiolipin synthase [Treponema pectinovorum]|uniref:cardiolipin synthase n=1 Tax=Treponema pectinovorum TaxID=164 RepID=UPI0011CA7AAA|nr:cardiolipin synthase [Treponema pectinovorum]
MLKGLKRFSRGGIFRLVVTFISFGIQIFWLWSLSHRLEQYSTLIAVSTDILVAMLIIHVYNKQNYSISLKVPWIILILVFPIIGISLYFLSENNHQSKKVRLNTLKTKREVKRFFQSDSSVINEIEKLDKRVANQFFYLSKNEHFPAFINTYAKFYGNTTECFLEQLKALRLAKKFIFIEYHAIEDAKAFSQMLKILEQKVKDAVEVRILYDDVGSIGFINRKFTEKMAALNIRCKDFNSVSPLISLFMNNRDHRKMMIIDEKVAFTGGYNIADEYFNYTSPYGHWKDSGLKIRGTAVNTFTQLFLEMWNSSEKKIENLSSYFENSKYKNSSSDGFIQPYADTPLDNSYTGENVYLNIIKWAENYVYITTPYLILGDEMKRELFLAALRGVDVRIVTPGIPDKKLIYKLTRSFYSELIAAGIKIFEYSPGFIHSKQMLADDSLAAVGTINMDFRSFHHNFENGVLMYKTGAISSIKDDFDSIFKVSADVSEKYKKRKKHFMSFSDRVLRLFSTLL